MLYTTVVTTEYELLQINKLNHQNLKDNLSLKDQEVEGFVTWLYPVSLLQQMHCIASSVIVKYDDRVVGYALVTPIEVSSFHPSLKLMIDNVESLQYENRPLSAYTYYVMGQVCIDKEFRGKGIFKMLFQKHKDVYSDKYELLVTEISTKNFRSQKAHEKVGFKTIHTYSDSLDEWNVVVWDWRLIKKD